MAPIPSPVSLSLCLSSFLDKFSHILCNWFGKQPHPHPHPFLPASFKHKHKEKEKTVANAEKDDILLLVALLHKYVLHYIVKVVL